MKTSIGNFVAGDLFYALLLTNLCFSSTTHPIFSYLLKTKVLYLLSTMINDMGWLPI